MTQTQNTREAAFEQLAQLLSGIAFLGSEVEGVLRRSTLADDTVRRTTDFLRSQGAHLEAALGDKKAHALVKLMEALVEAQIKTRTDAQESLSRLLGLVRQVEALLAELSNPPRPGGGTYELAEPAPQVSQGEIPP